ncbi:hypothetical protein LOTGIDRAFT_173368 [Lottia gigantea]|uniref:Uncharacterized protein n=1 Tax=Lottia gigantea TaxID=225164 RepID=V4A8B5_LOTGI|nr:hypothetical protein LOTGIDRAFT_173368 [Lottia gigantea]ESP00209.1 hypothetical protein LOTGIDRAFT_173368 [Lottia gigantea]
MPVHFNQKLEIYNQCNGKRTCDVIFPTDSPVKLEIPYVCESEADLRLISTRFAQNAVTFPIFSLWGKDYTKGEILNCECQMEIPKNMSALIEVFFIYLDPEACNKVIFSNKNIPIFSCNKYGLRLLYGPQGNIEGDMKIQIKDLVIEGDEVIYFKLRGENMNINCNGCSYNSDSPESPESPEVSESFMYHVILGTVFGILAVVFLVVAVCVLYRLRKRKLSRQRGQRSPQQIIENEHYDYIDDDAPTNMKNNCHSHQYLDLINSPDGYLTPQVPAAHQRPLGPRTSAESSYNRIVVQ